PRTAHNTTSTPSHHCHQPYKDVRQNFVTSFAAGEPRGEPHAQSRRSVRARNFRPSPRRHNQQPLRPSRDHRTDNRYLTSPPEWAHLRRRIIIQRRSAWIRPNYARERLRWLEPLDRRSSGRSARASPAPASGFTKWSPSLTIGAGQAGTSSSDCHYSRNRHSSSHCAARGVTGTCRHHWVRLRQRLQQNKQGKEESQGG
ncbi:hypothetical protein GE09DRAFT_1280286, partial [Coniochaeta sp. 2T2.1]